MTLLQGVENIDNINERDALRKEKEILGTSSKSVFYSTKSDKIKKI